MVPGSDVVYGDSVAEYTPIYIRLQGVVFITTFDDLASRIPWDKDARGKEYTTPLAMETWSETGWTPVKRLIRHKHTGPLIRVATSSGVVDVTQDHSLVDSQGNMIKPSIVRVGDSLLHAPLPQVSSDIQEFEPLASCGLFDGVRTERTSQLEAAGVVAMISDMGLHHTIDVSNGVYGVTVSMKAPPEQRNTVISKESIEYTGKYVYDISTENQHFSAGPVPWWCTIRIL